LQEVFYVDRAMPIARQRVGKHIAGFTLSTIQGHPLVGKGSLNKSRRSEHNRRSGVFYVVCRYLLLGNGCGFYGSA
jgi:hypothetical protein